MTIVILVIMIETTADILAVGEIVGTKVDARRVGDGLRADMVATTVAPVFNSFPATAFAQNVGLVAITGIKSRSWSPRAAGCCSCSGSRRSWPRRPRVPLPVLGGAGIVLFGWSPSGIRTLSQGQRPRTQPGDRRRLGPAFGLPARGPRRRGSGLEFPECILTIFDSGISSARADGGRAQRLLQHVASRACPRSRAPVAAGPPVMVREQEIAH